MIIIKGTTFRLIATMVVIGSPQDQSPSAILSLALFQNIFLTVFIPVNLDSHCP